MNGRHEWPARWLEMVGDGLADGSHSLDNLFATTWKKLHQLVPAPPADYANAREQRSLSLAIACVDDRMAARSDSYFTARGLRETAPEVLNEALRMVLDSMPAAVHESATTGLTAEEQAVLREGGLTLEPAAGSDPVADTAVKFAAIVKRSLPTNEVSRRLGLAPSRVRQMIADRSLYSFLIDGNRRIPDFQLGAGGRPIPDITRVNKALSPRLHPVEVYNWYHLPNADLFLNDDVDATMSPLDWLRGGHDPDLLLLLASRL